jgi:hypothetical protein
MLKLCSLKFKKHGITLLISSALCACAQSQAPMTDAQLGAAVVAARQAQTLRASAPNSTLLPDRYEANMARAALHHAQQNFAHPQAMGHGSMMGQGR